MKRSLKLVLAALAITVVTGGVWSRSRRRHRHQDIAQALKAAGYPTDDQGRVILTPNDSGLSLAYDPNLRDPTTGFRSAMAALDSCVMASKTMDACIREAPRCVSQTPWKDDPAGEDCLPDSCAEEYRELRRTLSEAAAGVRLARGTCYTGMKDLLSGKLKL